MGGVKPRIDCVEYNAVALSATTKSRQKVLWANYYVWGCGEYSVSVEGYYLYEDECGGWAIPVCGYYHEQATILVEADLLCTDEDVPGGTYLTDEEFVTWGQAAEKFVYADGTSWDSVFAEKIDMLSKFTSVINEEVYDVCKNGVNDYYESRVANPDSFLEDMTEIVTGKTQNYYERRFMRNVFDEVCGVESVCVEGDWVSLADECSYIKSGGSGSGSGRGRGRGKGGVGMVVAMMVAFAMV